MGRGVRWRKGGRRGRGRGGAALKSGATGHASHRPLSGSGETAPPRPGCRASLLGSHPATPCTAPCTSHPPASRVAASSPPESPLPLPPPPPRRPAAVAPPPPLLAPPPRGLACRSMNRGLPPPRRRQRSASPVAHKGRRRARAARPVSPSLPSSWRALQPRARARRRPLQALALGALSCAADKRPPRQLGCKAQLMNLVLRELSQVGNLEDPDSPVTGKRRGRGPWAAGS
jgi:hypothetical protein